MQYKTSKKILIDKRKFETLKRLNCPKEILIDLIFENKLTLTGDSLIDDNLESLIEIKEFKNWGGNHNPNGNNQYTLGQVDQQVDLGQNIGQVVDKDKDKDIDKDIDLTFNEDLFFDKNIQKVVSLYREHCKSLIPIKFEHRTRERLIEIKEFLKVVGLDFNYVIDLMDKANKQKVFYENKISLKSLIKNHAEIYSGLGASTVNQPQGSTNLTQKLNELAKKYSVNGV